MLTQIGALFTPKLRLSLYGIASAALLVLVFYHVVDAAAVPIWLGLASAILGVAGNTTAAINVAVQLRSSAATRDAGRADG